MPPRRAPPPSQGEHVVGGRWARCELPPTADTALLVAMVEQHEATGEPNDPIPVEPPGREQARHAEIAPGAALEAETAFVSAGLVAYPLTLEVAARVDPCEQTLG